MLLSVDNFKSIEHVVNVDVSGLTVLAGVNSSGKSSLIQALLLLKQTLNSTSSEMLNLSGPYVYANSLFDLMHNKRSGEMRFVVNLTGEEIDGRTFTRSDKTENRLDSLEISVSFRVRQDSYLLSEFKLKSKFKNGEVENLLLRRWPKKNAYDLITDEYTLKSLVLDSYSFANFFPVFVRDENTIHDLTYVKQTREALIDYLNKVVYIAPLRVAPVLTRSFQTDVERRYVLPDGENTRFILDMMSERKDDFNLVKQWICDRFELARDLNIVKESGKLYRVVVTTNEGVKVDLMHMGFGLSQILPIVTQGCISQPDSLMIVEDPDVHMHPSIQAAMADFFIFLCLKHKVSLLVETHSDHFITRIRRRIAEKEIQPDKIHLIFVMNDFGASEYKSIPLSDAGRLEGSMPPRFLDTRDTDFKAIIEANRR